MPIRKFHELMLLLWYLALVEKGRRVALWCVFGQQIVLRVAAVFCKG
jgi:hypothetical protein